MRRRLRQPLSLQPEPSAIDRPKHKDRSAAKGTPSGPRLQAIAPLAEDALLFAAATDVAVALCLQMQALVAQLLRGWSPERSDPRLMGLGIRSGPSVVAAGVGLGYAPCIPGPLRSMRYASSLRSSPRVIL
jgi:hypothetical protein